MSEPKLNIKEESSAKKTRSPPKKAKVEQSVPRKKKLKTDAEKTAEKNQHLRFGKAELTPDELSRLSKAQKREMYAAHAARSAVHHEVDQYEDENVGVQALSEGEKAAGNVRDISKSRYARKLKKKAKMQGKKGSKTAKSSASEPTAAQDAGASGTSEGGSKFFAGYQPFVNMCVGGVTREGRDATNDLTYLLMDAVRHVRIYQPSLATRVHNKSPEKYLRKIVDVIRSGMGFPAVHFDDTHIKMMLAKGVSIEDARDYCLMGCVEPQKAGRLYQWTSTSYTQWPICIELVLNHGVPLWYGKKVCPDLGDLKSFDTWEKFDAAVKEQIKYITKWTAVATVISQRVHRELAPKPLMSVMYEGCMEHGRDVSSGGAMYNFGPGVVWSGLATYTDSMAAIRKLVYDDKKYTLEQLNEALKADFKGYEQIRADCLAAPKYGNDDDYADLIAADLIAFTEREHRRYKTLYSVLSHGTLSISNNTPFGQLTGASANGRPAWQPLSDGISPTQGADYKGPTAIIKSVSKMANDNMNIGLVHNFKLMSGLLDTPEGENGIVTLIRTASILGNGEMQFNYLDNDVLLKAQDHPEDYRDLVVRVAGYSAFFVELCKDVQDEIISRTVLRSI